MLLNEKIFEKGETLKEQGLPKGVLLRVRYPIMRFGVRNANNRVYKREVAEKVLNDPNIQYKLKTRTLFGSQEHPVESQVKLSKDETSHIISNIYIGEEFNKKLGEAKLENNVLYADFDVLNTDCGKFINVLFESQCLLGVSTRADGEILEEIDEKGSKYNNVIAEAYIMQSVDFTGDPSTPDVLPEIIQKNIIDLTKTNYESHNINKNVAIALLEKVGTEEAKQLEEKIKIDKQHKDCKCKLGEKKCSGECNHSKEDKKVFEKLNTKVGDVLISERGNEYEVVKLDDPFGLNIKSKMSGNEVYINADQVRDWKLKIKEQKETTLLENLIEAKRIIVEVSSTFKDFASWVNDSEYLHCLANEIEEARKTQSGKLFVAFSLDENFNGLFLGVGTKKTAEDLVKEHKAHQLIPVESKKKNEKIEFADFDQLIENMTSEKKLEVLKDVEELLHLRKIKLTNNQIKLTEKLLNTKNEDI